MTRPVSLNAVKWGKLCDLAIFAATRLSPEAAAELLREAGRLTTVTPPHASPWETTLATSFRWDCNAFAVAPPELRPALSAGLQLKAQIMRAILDGLTPDPARMVIAAMPETAMPPAWTRRADIGGA